MRSTILFSALATIALVATGCRVTVTRSGDCGVCPDRCSTQFQERCVGGLFRPFQGLRGGDAACTTCDGSCNGSCDGSCGGAVSSGCGCDNVSPGCGCNTVSDYGGGAGYVSESMGGGLLSSRRMGSGVGMGLRDGGGLPSLSLPRLNGAGYEGQACSDPNCAECGTVGDGGMGWNQGEGVALAGYDTGRAGCGRFGCGAQGRLCLGCRLKNLVHGGRGGHGGGLIHKVVPNGISANQPYGGQIPHTEPIPSTMGPESQSPTYSYPYYSLRGPRDFLQNNPTSIGY